MTYVAYLHFHIVPRFLGDDFDTVPHENVDERIRIEQAEALRRAGYLEVLQIGACMSQRKGTR